MSKLVLNGDTSGSVTLDAPAVSGTTTLTLPTTTGTLVVTSGAQTIEFADGSASAPSITNSGDTNTGIFFPAADTIAFAEGGVEAMRLDSSGNVGIGASTANERLVINGSTNINSAIRLQNQGTNIGFISTLASWQGSGSDNTFTVASVGALAMMFATNGVERMRITSAGLLQYNNGYGSVATVYGCRAWIKFDGTTATPTINGNGNVSSITDNGTGDYTLNFTTAMPDTNYNLVMSMSHAAARLLWTNGFTTTTARVVCANTSQVQQDGIISVAVFR